jgi:NagD protein
MEGIGDPPTCIIIGSTMSFDYSMMAMVVEFVLGGVEWCITGDEALFSWNGKLWPGTGAIAAGIEKATGKAPLLLGKPSPRMFCAARRYFKPDARIVVIGDDLGTDISGALACGLDHVLVLSGVTRESHMASCAVRPTQVAADLAMFVAGAFR